MAIDEGSLDEASGRNERARSEACRILGIDERADAQVVKKAYRLACLKYHPDANPGDEQAHRRFLIVQCAYELLTEGVICSLLLEQMESVLPRDTGHKYNRDSHWGFFAWWREQFFDDSKDGGDE